MLLDAKFYGFELWLNPPKNLGFGWDRDQDRVPSLAKNNKGRLPWVQTERSDVSQSRVETLPFILEEDLLLGKSVGADMEAGAVLSCLLALLLITVATILVLLLLSSFSTILPVKRNIFTRLDSLLVISIGAQVAAQVAARLVCNVLNHSLIMYF